jgi:putative addiction module killer protein
MEAPSEELGACGLNRLCKAAFPMVNAGHEKAFSGRKHEIVLDVRRFVYLITHMFEVRQTEIFASWLSGLTDLRAIARVDIRIRRLSLGNIGDAKSLGEGLSEMRIDYGPGYRLYFTRRGDRIVILLCGGDKKRQSADIVRARQLLKDLDDDS